MNSTPLSPNTKSDISAHLNALESESIYILREAFSACLPSQIVSLWSLGKDSTVVLWLIKKALLGCASLSFLHVDTGKKFKEMYAFRDKYTSVFGIDLIVYPCPAEEKDTKLPKAIAGAQRKTQGLYNFLEENKQIKMLISAIRYDESGIRAKERVFSPRYNNSNKIPRNNVRNSDDLGTDTNSDNADNADNDNSLVCGWNTSRQPLELWPCYTLSFPKSHHIRVHPIFHWKEIDIWLYIRREKIPVVPLYFSHNGQRYRSLGDEDITNPVPSLSRTVDDIIDELYKTKVSERSGRLMDHEDESSFEKLRTDGYF